MRPQEIIAKKRDGGELSAEEIRVFIDGVCSGEWADYQISALVMAIFIRGLSQTEQSELTRAMLMSGETLDMSDIELPVADKHSTGGVGDKTSLVIAPLAAACGLAVPMISGRGLGHTGGTLDKLESIPGYNVHLSTGQFKSIMKECGFAMMGQTAEIAPADKKLYALRDATATVPYIPLIVASIMSKKLAEGLDALVLDVKTGSGAFMQAFDDSRRLAEAMVETGGSFGVKTMAIVSDMSQPLGKHVGNACEVYECINILRGTVKPAVQPTLDLSIELTAAMLRLAGVSEDDAEARSAIDDALSSGRALDVFRKNIELQGGDPRVCDEPKLLLNEKLIKVPVLVDRAGFISAIDTFAVGKAVCEIGGGRIKAEDGVDYSVGFASEVKIGDKVGAGELIGFVYCRKAGDAESAVAKLKNAYEIRDVAPAAPELIRATIT
ncbi:MAG: thymidine phosphorylase [Pyrinomonadaceae bacterium]|nr:thymidine phosphorylase [Pyrinomonadaceae bacterium]